MSVAVKTHPIHIRFKPKTPARVIHSVKKQFANYIIDEDEEYIDWLKTDLHKEIVQRMTPAKTLRNLREMCGWTLAETGKRIGVSPYRISDYENSHREISKAIAKQLGKLFNVSPAVFI